MTSQGREADQRSLSIRVRKQLAGGFRLDVAFEAPAGFTMLLGPSGAGKTTLLNCIAGLMRPDTGRVGLGARVLFDSDSAVEVPVRERGLGYLFQTLALFPHLTVEQNVEYGIAKLAQDERRARITQVLDSFRVGHLIKRKPGEISGGERQRVALARSIVTDPGALLLDEPMVALDYTTRSRLLEDLRAWNEAHAIPILYVTHSPEEAFALGERVAVIEGGRILQQGLPQEVLTTPWHETVAQVVGFENVFDATVKSIAKREGTMRCRLDGSSVELETPLTQAAAGDRVRIAIRAGDIMIAIERPQGLSARNVFQGRLAAIAQEGATVILTLEAGVRFEVHLTPGARDQLGLATGSQVWMVIKTYSCSIVEPSFSSPG